MFTVIRSLTRDGRDRGRDYKLSGFHVPPGCWDASVVFSGTCSVSNFSRSATACGQDYKFSGFHVPQGCWDAAVHPGLLVPRGNYAAVACLYGRLGDAVPGDAAFVQVLDCVQPGPDEIVLPKTSSSMFGSTNVTYLLHNMGIDQLVRLVSRAADKLEQTL